MPVKTMNPTLGDLLKREHSRETCREAVTLATGNLLLGTVLGRTAVNTASTTVAAVGGNTGNGTIAAHATPVRASAVVGTYRAVMTSATAFNVFDPDGNMIGQGATGTLFATEVAFTITVGGTPMVSGDSFTIITTAGSGQVRQIAATAQSDGSHLFAGILLQDTDASSAVQPTVMLARGPAVLSSDRVIWPAGLNTAALRAPAIAAMAALGIVIRQAD